METLIHLFCYLKKVFIHMNTWIVGKFNETTLRNEKAFYSELYLEDITDEDYIHALKLFKIFNLKNLGEYHNLYVQSDTLLHYCLQMHLNILEINV